MIGIGKSSLVKEVVNKLSDRNTFSDGILYFDMKGKSSIEDFISILQNEKSIWSLLKKQNMSLERDSDKNLKDIIACLAPFHALIVLDNLDNLFLKYSSQIRELLNNMITASPSLKILITVFSRIESVQANFIEQVYELKPLSDYFSAILLIKRATRRIPDDEIDKLYLDFPCKSVGKQLLEHHKLIQLLRGLPQMILIAASILHKKSLSDIFSLLTTEKTFEKLISEAGSNCAVESSVDVALQIIEGIGELENFKLACYFPSGVLVEDLPALWGEGYEQHLQKFVGYSLMYKNTNKDDITYYTINGFLMEQIKKYIAEQEFADYLFRLLAIYAKKMEKYFMQIGTLSQKKNISLFNFEENNIR
jgi:nucleoside-triphosphatase THEP1